ncbi:M28 family peptidase [Novosphingopyxis sp.]|uniref:M28 family peptidase n=1 Tax=Novosphingopyxis sp. TaxID=2709690 RepID=UPI003B5B9200
MIRHTALAALLLATAAPAFAQADMRNLTPMQQEAMDDNLAYAITEGLVTEVGHRMAGTEDEARARAWAEKKLTELGFANVRIETYRMPTWVRGKETAEVLSPAPQDMHIAALGTSGSTGDAGIEGEIAYFPSLSRLMAAPAGSLTGKIAFVTHDMRATQDGSGYGFAGPVRWRGPNFAARAGASAIVIRSVGTDHHRNPHTGGTTFDEGVKHIPAGAISNPDADTLERLVALGRPVRMKLVLTPKDLGMRESGNVIAEVPGADPGLPPIVIACHLDSWDLSPSAIDDAAGCGIITAAAKRVMAMGQPRRTIRLLWAGAEEVGGFGGEAYGKKYGDQPHALAMESDFGADRVWKVDFNLADEALKEEMTLALAPLGIERGDASAHGGTDVDAIIAAAKPAVIDLAQDGTRYFDLHHTPDDTLDKVDPAQIAQNVAAWTTVLQIAANHDGAIVAGEESHAEGQ